MGCQGFTLVAIPHMKKCLVFAVNQIGDISTSTNKKEKKENYWKCESDDFGRQLLLRELHSLECY